MAGIEGIEQEILEEANTSAKELLESAQVDAKEILATSQVIADKHTKESRLRIEKEIAAYRERIDSNVDMILSRATLEAKQEVISETLQLSYERFLHQDDASYRAALKKMIAAYARAGEGKLFLNQKDLKELSSDFLEELLEIAKEKGSILTLSDEAKKIDRGFLLIYGGIEENCSFEAIFENKKDELTDLIQREIFS